MTPKDQLSTLLSYLWSKIYLQINYFGSQVNRGADNFVHQCFTMSFSCESEVDYLNFILILVFEHYIFQPQIAVADSLHMEIMNGMENSV